MKEAGLQIDPDWVAPSEFDMDSGAAATDRLIHLKNRPTAIFAINDNTAIGALSTLSQNGLSIPNDMSLVGYNDPPVLGNLPVPLTTVNVPFDQIATNAMELLNLRIRHKEAQIRMVKPTLIPRKSTAPIVR